MHTHLCVFWAASLSIQRTFQVSPLGDKWLTTIHVLNCLLFDFYTISVLHVYALGAIHIMHRYLCMWLWFWLLNYQFCVRSDCRICEILVESVALKVSRRIIAVWAWGDVALNAELYKLRCLFFPQWALTVNVYANYSCNNLIIITSL